MGPNSDLIEGVQQISTFDSRTTVVCWARANKIWDLQGNPINHDIPYNGGPPLHYNCRSAEISILRRKLPKHLEDKIPASKRATMYGLIDADVDPQEWLRKQPWAEETLGKTRYKLWMDGTIKDLSQLLDQSGNPLNIEKVVGYI